MSEPDTYKEAFLAECRQLMSPLLAKHAWDVFVQYGGDDRESRFTPIEAVDFVLSIRG